MTRFIFESHLDLDHGFVTLVFVYRSTILVQHFLTMPNDLTSANKDVFFSVSNQDKKIE